MMTVHIHRLFPLLACLLCLASCDVKDDLPLPLVKVSITAFEVDGQCDANDEGFAGAVIDNDRRTVEVYVNDLVDLSRLKVTLLEMNRDAEVSVQTPQGRVPLSRFYVGEQPVIDFRDEVTFVLSTYQDYLWRVRVRQVIFRDVVLENQVGNAIIDTLNHNVVVYVTPDQDLSAVKVEKFNLGGRHGTVIPDPTGTVMDFTDKRMFRVRECSSAHETEWSVFVFHSGSKQTVTAEVFPHAVNAYVSGQKKSGVTPVVEYRLQGADSWTSLPSEQVQYGALDYTATIAGLQPGMTYECRVTAGDVSSSVCTFTTADALQLPNGSFDEWSTVSVGKQSLYQPWAEGAAPYWDTGNRGATTVGASNSTSVTEGGRTFANLQSRYIVIKFAAGSIFTGTYLKTDGTNGILAFGRPFQSFPTKMQFDFTYKTSTINRGGGKWDENYGRYITQELYDGLRGRPDSCQVYVALIGDEDEEEFQDTRYPLVLRTRTSELKLFNPRSTNVIAYAQMTVGEDVPEWTTETLTLDYRSTERVPKYILVVASSSKYGDYFIGGDESLLRLDNVKLLYE